MSPTKEQEESISKLCQQLSQGLSALSNDDPFTSFQSPQSNHTSPAFQKSQNTPQNAGMSKLEPNISWNEWWFPYDNYLRDCMTFFCQI